MQDLTDRTSTIINQIEKITNKKKGGFRISDPNIRSNKISDDDKGLESQKNIWQILKRKNARLIRKLHYFMKFFIERIYIDIFLWIINIPRINTQPFLESIKKIINKYITNETNQEKMDKTNQSLIHFISTIKKALYNTNISNKNSNTFCDLSHFSQAYVFYKLSQTQFIPFYFYKLKSVFQCNGAAPFIKNEIKDYFIGTQELFHSQLRHKNRQNSGINQWTNWLRNHYQYDISQIRWSRLVSQKWRNRFNQHCTNQNKDLCNSSKKTKFIHYEKQNNFETASLLNEKENFKKQYRYDRLAYKSINSEDTKYSSIYESPLHVKNNQEVFSNSNTNKRKSFYMMEGIPIIPINKDLVQDDIRDMEKNLDRKYFDWRILDFCLRTKIDSEAWINIDTDPNSNKKSTKAKLNNYQIIDKIKKKNLFYLTIHQDQEINLSNQKRFFDWMGMNEEILNRPISNLERWFFPEFLIFYNLYKTKPWVIPIKLLLLDSNINENATDIENKSIVGIASQ
ncbi:hypothetical protein RchiOBHm_Chr7g0212321 [Rosa chinensis]|uniref:Protein TIC 214 n=1 Tax=Rosa chinensis TaxID=74649 RepID=A0A2P6PAP3_ROSCH|nr:hypothetical protein RchiOBHm_Chr7g0212321 [Rosa chinensis]